MERSKEVIEAASVAVLSRNRLNMQLATSRRDVFAEVNGRVLGDNGALALLERVNRPKTIIDTDAEAGEEDIRPILPMHDRHRSATMGHHPGKRY